MSEYVNYNSVVIDLEPNENANTNVRVASFDQAFLGEEFSEARGKGRARRKSRRLERISNKREVRTERRKLKSDRGAERIERRKTRKSARQDIRGDQQDARMERRNKRREDKESRNGGSETDSEEEEDTATQQGGGRDQGSEDSQDTGSTGSGSGDSEDTGTSGGGYDDSEDTQTPSGSNSDDGYDEDEDSQDYSDEAEENFAGDGSEFAFEVTGKPSVPNAIQTICYKIEMNNEMISQLMQHKKMLEAKRKDVSKINNALGDKYSQNQALEGKLENFAGADGKVDRSKAKAVKIAKRKARAKRIENLPIPPVMLYKLLKKGVSKDKIKTWWETKGRKEQASKMNFEGGNDEFGMSSEPTDYMDYSEFGTPAYDYEPNTPEVINMDSPANEPVMNFSGSETNTYWRSFLIGGVIAFAGIYIIRKYKLLK
jgi:hypothetical protein